MRDHATASSTKRLNCRANSLFPKILRVTHFESTFCPDQFDRQVNNSFKSRNLALGYQKKINPGIATNARERKVVRASIEQ
jgi:hypothetical protein